jgi:hypothetical protein
VAIGDYFSIVHVPNPVEQLEQVALGRVEGKIADVETRRCDFDRLGLMRRPRLLLLLLLWLVLLLV